MNLNPINQCKLYGYGNILSTLNNLYSQSILPNKILFSGQKAMGKSTLAYHLINCILSKGEDYEYDIENFEINSNNRSYLLTQNGSNPNFNLIDVLPDKKNIDIQQIRSLINLMNKSSFNDKLRFILIDNIEFLNLSSINSLLKFLEEPNDNICFILIHNNTKILPTLKSRCINFKFFFSNYEAINIANKLTNIDVKNEINSDLLHYYLSPGKIYKLLEFSKSHEFDLKKLTLKKLLKKIINENTYKKDNVFKNLFYELIESFLRNTPHLIYSDYTNYYLKKINHVKKYNLDEESFFIEFDSKLLNG